MYLVVHCRLTYGCGGQIFGDPEAADIVFTSGADVLVVGLNVTHQVIMTGKEFELASL